MKNSIRTGLLAVSACCLFTGSLMAQTTQLDKNGYISIGPELGLPVGGMSDRYSWGLGASMQADLPLIDQLLFITGNIGYSNFYTKSAVSALVSDLALMPLKVGIKIFPADNLYLQASAGASFILDKTKAGYDKSTAFTYAPQVGYQFKAGKTDVIDLGVNFQGNSKFSTGGSANNLFGLRLAYGFGL